MIKGVQVQFCKNRKCCPIVEKTENGSFIIGAEEEGFTVFSKTNFEDFISAAKEGKFDHLIQ